MLHYFLNILIVQKLDRRQGDVFFLVFLTYIFFLRTRFRVCVAETRMETMKDAWSLVEN